MGPSTVVVETTLKVGDIVHVAPDHHVFAKEVGKVVEIFPPVNNQQLVGIKFHIAGTDRYSEYVGQVNVTQLNRLG